MEREPVPKPRQVELHAQALASLEGLGDFEASAPETEVHDSRRLVISGTERRYGKLDSQRHARIRTEVIEAGRGHALILMVAELPAANSRKKGNAARS